MAKTTARKRECPIKISRLHHDALAIRAEVEDRTFVSVLGKLLDAALQDEIRAIRRLAAIEREKAQLGQTGETPTND